MISVSNHHDINIAVQCSCSDSLLSLSQSCFVCSRVKVWLCIGVDPPSTFNHEVYHFGESSWYCLFNQVMTPYPQIVLMSLLAAMVSSLPQGGQGQGEGEKCTDELDCLRQSIPGKRVSLMRMSQVSTNINCQVNQGRTIPSTMWASCANSIPRTLAAQDGANKCSCLPNFYK